ncbi:MAG: type transport system permease protein [Candidatus Eremiobacteraeota bacterium]|jgi:ABC-2 type transport system permease protein|nr:type transport system permease protein [Candidatus Eremiobacteraeota bacterium]
MMLLRMFLMQTKMNFVWYFRRDGEMMFWTLAMPVFFLVLFSFAFSTGPNSGSAKFLVPGIIGAQVLSSGFWGVGVMLATFREKHLLRRVYLTPMPPWVFFGSLVVYRMVLLAAQAVILVAAGALLFHVRITGNPLEILAILLLGTATFISLGTIIGALARTTESANNIASILTVPLAFLSDAYVPIDRFPHAVSSALRLLPSTQFIDTFRDVSTYGAPLAHYGAWIGLLVLWAIAGTLISARTFRWV